MTDRFVEARSPSNKALAMARQIANPSLLSLALYSQALAASITDPHAGIGGGRRERGSGESGHNSGQLPFRF